MKRKFPIVIVVSSFLICGGAQAKNFCEDGDVDKNNGYGYIVGFEFDDAAVYDKDGNPPKEESGLPQIIEATEFGENPKISIVSYQHEGGLISICRGQIEIFLSTIEVKIRDLPEIGTNIVTCEDMRIASAGISDTAGFRAGANSCND